MPPTAFVKSSRLRVSLRRHPWIYRDSVERVEGTIEDGGTVVVRDPKGKFLAHAFVNSASRLFLRLVSFDKATKIDDALLRARIRDAVALRHTTLGLPERAEAYRVVHSEGDGLPGLIVDRYGDVLVLTCSSLGTHLRLDPILDELEAQLSPRAIVEAGVAEGLRKAEGLPEGRGVLRGELPAEDPVVEIDGVKLLAPLRDGQKTALFLDQRENVRRVAELARGRRVLDVCCYVGGFGIAAAQAGAASCLMFDASAEAIQRATENVERNGVGDLVTVRQGQMFRELHDLAKGDERFGLIVLDPPKFAHTRGDRRKAHKGLVDANILALRLLEPGGLLLTCSCSHHIGDEDLEQVLREAAVRTDVSLRILERRGAGADHPVDVHCSEGRYLRALLVQRREA
jgi:23S rRNA (cytosine1962-C5)-methyltransferase